MASYPTIQQYTTHTERINEAQPSLQSGKDDSINLKALLRAPPRGKSVPKKRVQWNTLSYPNPSPLLYDLYGQSRATSQNYVSDPDCNPGPGSCSSLIAAYNIPRSNDSATSSIHQQSSASSPYRPEAEKRDDQVPSSSRKSRPSSIPVKKRDYVPKPKHPKNDHTQAQVGAAATSSTGASYMPNNPTIPTSQENERMTTESGAVVQPKTLEDFFSQGDIVNLLFYLAQLKEENKALENYVAGLSKRKKDLKVKNARLNALVLVPQPPSGT